MTIKNLRLDFSGQLDAPRYGKMLTTDTMATATSAGYLNNFVKSENIPIFTTDGILVSASDDTRMCKVIITSDSIQLSVM